MNPLHDAMYPKTTLTPKQRDAIAEVHAIAAAYCDLPPDRQRPFLEEIRKLTTARQRWYATRHTPPNDPAFAPLMTMLDALIANQGMFKTAGGWFSRADLAAAECRFEREDGGESIVFPVAYPWRTKPDDETGRGGVRDDALYRHKNDRAPFRSTFSQLGPRSVVTREKDFWDE